MKHNVLKRIAQIFLTLSGVIAVFYVSPLLAVPLRMQFHWSAQSVLLLQDCFGCGGSAVLLVDCGAGIE